MRKTLNATIRAHNVGPIYTACGILHSEDEVWFGLADSLNVNLRSIAFINGVVLSGTAIALLIPLIFDLFCSRECFSEFATSILLTLFVGGSLAISFKSKEKIVLTTRDGFILLTVLWLSVSIFCALPFYLYEPVNVNFVTALFESVSGLSTTGSTIYNEIESIPRALVLWRFVLELIGGMGIIAIGVMLFPILRIGGMQLFLTEYSDKNSKMVFPRVSQIATMFFVVYASFIFVVAVLLKISGMNTFDSICHSISAISTGGFSTRNNGLEFYNSRSVELVLSLGMFVGGLTFLEIVRLIKAGVGEFWNNQQTRFYIKLSIMLPLIVLIIGALRNGLETELSYITQRVFDITAGITGTGFSFPKVRDSESFIYIIFVVVSMVGGCSGSATGGMKIFRVQVIFQAVKQTFVRMLKPYDVSTPKYKGQKISDSLVFSVVSFVVLMAITFVVSTLILSITTKYDISICMWTTYSSLFNVGLPFEFLNEVDVSITDSLSKLILIIDMIVGRLELIPVFILFSKHFWKH